MNHIKVTIKQVTDSIDDDRYRLRTYRKREEEFAQQSKYLTERINDKKRTLYALEKALKEQP